MSQTTSSSSTTTGTTVVIGIIIFVMIVATIFILYYILTRPSQIPFPQSPFNFGDILQISPAIPAVYGPDLKNIDVDQYLTQVSFGSENCYIAPDGRAGGQCAMTFTGNKNDSKTKWILKQFDSTGKLDAKQNVFEYGNRFFLQNSSSLNSIDASGRASYIGFDQTCVPANNGPDKTFFVNGSNDQDCYNTQLIAYFLPTTQPDLYYILFPTSTKPIDIGVGGAFIEGNNGVGTLRPWAPTPSLGNNTYCPWNFNSSNEIVLNKNGLLLSSIKPLTSGPFPNPEVFLFKVKKV